MGIDTFDEITTKLRTKLRREPDAGEIKAERDRQMRAWYAGMAISAATIPDNPADRLRTAADREPRPKR